MLKRSFILVLMMTILFISCDVTGNNTLNKSRIPELRLVSVGSDVFSKANTTAVADIDFGDVLATKKLYYLIENTGDIPVFNVRLSTAKDSIEISPNSIGTINPEGSAISTTPIISIICPHVIPESGVGSLMPMTIGEFTDSLNINYQFIAPFDSVGVWEEGDTVTAQTETYSVNSLKRGVILEPWVNEIILWESTNNGDYRFSTSAFTTVYRDPDSSLYFQIYNNGNVEIPYEIQVSRTIKSYYTYYPDSLSDKQYRDTLIYQNTLLPKEYLDLSMLDDIYYNSPIVTDSTYEATFWFYIYFTPTPYIIGLKDRSYLDGYLLFYVSISFRDLFTLNP